MSGAFANHAPAAAEGAGALVAKAQAIIGAAAARLDMDFHGHAILTASYWNVAGLCALGAAVAIVCALMGRSVGLTMRELPLFRGSTSTPSPEDHRHG
jgi:hypothetical protein